MAKNGKVVFFCMIEGQLYSCPISLKEHTKLLRLKANKLGKPIHEIGREVLKGRLKKVKPYNP